MDGNSSYFASTYLLVEKQGIVLSLDLPNFDTVPYNDRNHENSVEIAIQSVYNPLHRVPSRHRLFENLIVTRPLQLLRKKQSTNSSSKTENVKEQLQTSLENTQMSLTQLRGKNEKMMEKPTKAISKYYRIFGVKKL